MKPHLQGWNENQNGAQNWNCQEEPQEDAVKNLSHKFPVLHDLRKEKRAPFIQEAEQSTSELIKGCEKSNAGFGPRF